MEIPSAWRLAALRRWRLARGLSQAQLAALAGVTQAAISECESGRRVPSLRTAAKLAAAVRAPLPSLMRTEEPSGSSREMIDRLATSIVEGTDIQHPKERAIAEELAGLIIQKLRAHRAPGKRRVARRRWAATRRAIWTRERYGGRLPEQVLRRVDALLAMRGLS